MAISGLGVWVALHNTAFLKCYHANTKEMLTELNIAPAVTKMLAGQYNLDLNNNLYKLFQYILYCRL